MAAGRAMIRAAFLVAAGVAAGPASAGVTKYWNTVADFSGGLPYAITLSPTGSAGRAYLTLEHDSTYTCDPTSACDGKASYWSNDPQQGLDWRVTKYDPNGVQLWTVSYNSVASDADGCNGVGLDAAGNVIAVGDENRPDLGLGQGINLRLRRHDAAGGFLSTVDYDSPNHSTDSALAVSVSASGACVVVGYEDRQADLGEGLNWFVRKYDAAGNLLFPQKTYNDPGNLADVAYGVSFDAKGGFVVAGTAMSAGTNQDWWVQRYDPNGTVTWSAAYNSAGNLDDLAYGVAVSPAGVVAVVGNEDRTDIGQGKSWLIRKYSALGVPVSMIPCSSVITAPSGRSTGASFDQVGNSIAVGWEARADLGESDNWVIRKYDPSGVLSWLRAYDGPAHGNDRALAVSLDAGGNAAVAGYEDRSDVAHGDDWLVRKYDAGGALSWSRTYNGPASKTEHANAVAIAANGAVVAAGYEDRSDIGEGDNWFVRKYDVSGNVLWTRTWNGAADGEDRALAVAIAKSSGSVYVAGYETVAGEGKNWRVLKYAIAGNLLWSFTFNGVANLDDLATGLAIDGSSSVYVAGTTATAGQGDNWQVFKFTPGGAELLNFGYNDPDNGDDIVGGVGADREGNFTVAGSEDRLGQGLNWRATRYAPGGAPAWTVTYDDPGSSADAALGVAASLSGTVLVVGYENRADLGLGDLWRVWLLSPAGTDITVGSFMSATCAMETTARAAAFDSSDNLVVVGYEDRPDLGQGKNWLIRKYDSSDSLLWTAHFDSPGHAEDVATSVETDSAGNVVVAGYVTRTDVTQGKNWVVRKYSPTGGLLWSREYSSNSINDDTARSVAIDSSGNIVVAGDEYRYDQTQMVPLPFAIWGHDAVRVGNRVYVVGGCQQDSGGCGASGLPPYSVATVWFAPIDPTGDATGVGKGRIGPWTRAYYNFGDTGPAIVPWGPPMNPTQGIPIMRHKAVAVGNRIYVVGGTTQNCGSAPLPGAAYTTKRVYSTAVDPVTGQTGPWEAELPLIQNATDHGLVYAGGALYCIGGLLDVMAPDQFVQKAEIKPDGHLYSSNDLTWEPVLSVPPGNPPTSCALCSLCTCTLCAPCTEDCCRALNVCLGWNNFRPFSVMRTIAFVGAEFVPGSSGSVCRYFSGSYYGFLDDCNGIKGWNAGGGTGLKAQPGAGAIAYNGSLLSVGGGNGSAMQYQVLFNSAGSRGLIRTGGVDNSELRPAQPDGSELYTGGTSQYAFPVVVPGSPLVSYNGFVYAIGGEMGATANACQRVYRTRLDPTTGWVDAGSWLSPMYDLGTLAQMTKVSWSYSKTGPGAGDDWALCRYRVAGADGRWTCWTPRIPEEGSAPITPGYYTYASDVPGSNPFFRMPMAPDPFRYIQFEVSLYNDPANDGGPAPTLPRFDEFRIGYEPAIVPALPSGSGIEVAPSRDGKSVTIRFEVVAEGGEINAEFYNVAGELIARDRYAYLTGGVKSETVSTARWAPGVYIIVLRGMARTGDPGLYRSVTKERFKMLKGKVVVRR
ncbi:MAG: hypothetical protein AAB152_09320 [Candidatus Coatesbacteria bacterium]